MGIVLITAEGLRSWRDIELVGEWLVWLGAFVATIGIVQFTTGLNIAAFFDIPGLSANSDFGGVDSRSVLNRVSATAVHPIEYGVVLGGLLPLAVHRMIRRWSRPLAPCPAVVIFVGCFMSVSRSAVLVGRVAFVVLLLGWPARWRLNALLLTPFAVVGLRLAVPGLVGTLISLFKNLGNDPSISGRTSDYGVDLRRDRRQPALRQGTVHLRAALLPDRGQPVPHVRCRARCRRSAGSARVLRSGVRPGARRPTSGHGRLLPRPQSGRRGVHRWHDDQLHHLRRAQLSHGGWPDDASGGRCRRLLASDHASTTRTAPTDPHEHRGVPLEQAPRTRARTSNRNVVA